MRHPQIQDMVEALRTTLRTLEKNEKFQPNDPRLAELKRRILLALAKMRSEESDTADAA